MKSNLFAICGIDYSGKGTQIGFLKKDFPDFIYTREPGGTPDAEKIRELLLSEEGSKLSDEKRLELFFKSRKIHLEEKVLPALSNNQNIITDRFDGSSFAYQVRNEKLEEDFWKLREEVVEPYVNPIYIFLDISLSESLRRRSLAKGRDLNHFDEAAEKEIRDRRDRYLLFFEKLKSKNVPVYTINGENSPENVYMEFKKAITENL